MAMRLLLLLVPAVAMKCPGSPRWIHASAQLEVVAEASCQQVMEEVKARVANCSHGWHDPHNGGHYVLDSEAANELAIERQTGNKLFTDKMILSFRALPDAPSSTPQCGIEACSESQVFSIKDFSTNYCNLRNLYCGKVDGCVPMKHDFQSTEGPVEASRWAGTDKKACIVTSSTMLRGLGNVVDDALSCINGHCPLDSSTMRPSATCVLKQCSSQSFKCLFSSSCREGVLCEAKCAMPLAETPDAARFTGLQSCMRSKCPGFPPSKSCVALHCAVEAGDCALHETCRHALECAEKCVPVEAVI